LLIQVLLLLLLPVAWNRDLFRKYASRRSKSQDEIAEAVKRAVGQ
jgi:hypothetical protein